MWRPGAPAPGAAGKKKKKKKGPKPPAGGNDRRNAAASKAPSSTPAPEAAAAAAAAAATPTTASSTSSKAGDAVLELDSRPVMPGTRPVRDDSLETAPRPAKTELSQGLRNLRFMQRKDEASAAARAEAERLRKLREEKWVIDPALLQSNTGKLVCEPLLVAPKRAAGRRSFGAFNPSVEDADAQEKLNAKAAAQLAKLEGAAIDPDEMADYLASQTTTNNNNKRTSPAAPGGKKASKKRRKA